MHPPLLPSLRLRDHTVLWFDVAWRDGEQLVDPHPGAPQYSQHEVVPRAALVGRRKHLIDLFLFEVVGDVLHALPKRHIIGNNGCYFERDLSQGGDVRESVDKATIFLPHAAKK